VSVMQSIAIVYSYSYRSTQSHVEDIFKLINVECSKFAEV